eukprot:TRINITY_DN80596_c0_g1_i1.p1 TRINITY_DN80596_c0_g1~~TRINITY_DN80596_c0_g1_i1.p1  ORF type:complete len:595 (-),score=132.91 TRINITY_DN80596_c0_g1_i1:64-1848(-)
MASDDELWAALEEESAPPPPPAGQPSPPPPPDPSPPPPPGDGGDAAPPPPGAPPPGTACELCEASLPAPSRCGLCLTCRFSKGNPFRPAIRLLSWSPVKSGLTKELVSQLGSALDIRTGTLPRGRFIEVRCIRMDAPEWRYELCHSWPNGISLFVGDQRVMLKKPDADQDVDDYSFNPGPLDISQYCNRLPGEVNPRPLYIRAAITCPKTEQWAVGVVVVEPVAGDQDLCNKVIKEQAPQDARLQLDTMRIRAWVTAHRPDRVSKKDTLRCVEPPVLKLVDPTSLMRIEVPIRGVLCDHLTCFDLAAFIHTMKASPPKHAWCCPICDKPAPLHQLRIDAFAESVLKATEENVTEVLVADNGKWEVSAVEEPMPDSSEEEGPPFPGAPVSRANTAAQLQQAAMNLGRAFSAPTAPPPVPSPPQKNAAKAGRDRSRSPRGKNNKGGKDSKNLKPPEDEEQDKRLQAWEKLQGIERKVEEKRIGWLPDKTSCVYCNKAVMAKGGVYCGRKRPDGTAVGCFKSICWKCMNKGGKDTIGSIKTKKAEFEDLGPSAWWMHDKCMKPEDKAAYFGEEEEDIGKPKDMDEESDEEPGKFAWE